MDMNHVRGNLDLFNRFSFHPADADRGAKHEAVRDICAEVASFFDQSLPAGREKSTVITKLEEAMFWANAAIARNS